MVMLVPLLASITLSLVPITYATPTPPYILHEARTHIPAGWSHVQRYNPSSVLPFRFALAQPNIHKLDEFLLDVSHPNSPNYSKHWTPSQIAQTFAPSDETVDAVYDWLSSSGFDTGRLRVTPSKGWIEVNATVKEVERLLRTEYSMYVHESGRTHIACEAYHLPSDIAQYIDLVTPSVHFDAVVEKRDRRNLPAHNPGSLRFGGPKTAGKVSWPPGGLPCDELITPECLRELYQIPKNNSVSPNNSYGIVEYTPGSYLPTDLDMFFAMFSPSQFGESPKLVSIDGGTINIVPGGFDVNGESDLDLEYAMALVHPQPVTLYQVGDSVQGASFGNFLDALDVSYCTSEGGDDPTYDGIYPDPQNGGYKDRDCGTVTPASVISTSYGYNEADLSPAYAARQCAEYAKLGLMGVTILYSSGDYGVAGNGGECLYSNGTQGSGGTIFNPSFPSTCPYVTSVGATQMKIGSTVKDPEVACETVIYSGGGFSNRFPVPDYQKAVVDKYLTDNPPPYPSDLYASSGNNRAYPDLAANGANYTVIVDGIPQLVYGTSASAPVVGSILSLINGARLNAGKKPIGFINPTIYSPEFAAAFNDIVSGSNSGCGTAGFSTAEGWDPVTGLGTPDYSKLLELWMDLP